MRIILALLLLTTSCHALDARTNYYDYTQDAVGVWRFEDDLHTTAIDTSGNDLSGTLTSLVASDAVQGIIGKCYDYDGGSDYIDFGDVDAIDFATSLTVVAWVYHDDLDDDDTIVGNNENATYDGFLLYRDDSGSTARTDIYNITLWDSADADSVRVESATNSSPQQQWTCVAFTWIGGNATGLRLYINGVEDANSPSDSSSVSAISSSTWSLFIAQLVDGSKKFDGKIDEVAVFDRVLTALEIKDIYRHGLK